MITKYFGGIIPNYDGCKTTFDEELEMFGRNTISSYHDNMESLRVTEAYIDVLNYVARANKYIEECKPWELARDESKKEVLASCMNHLANTLRQAAIMLSPVLIEAPKKLYAQLGIGENNQTFESLDKFDALGGEIVTKGNPLFPRLDAKIEVEYIKDLMKNNK